MSDCYYLSSENGSIVIDATTGKSLFNVKLASDLEANGFAIAYDMDPDLSYNVSGLGIYSYGQLHVGSKWYVHESGDFYFSLSTSTEELRIP